MSNRLQREKSPYLRAHAQDPVDWYPWGEEAFGKARRENRPVFLSIGYSTCHWCHVMARESFADAAVAAELNRSYVPVKVDREERPDVDAVYMRACTALTGSGGWPLTLLLTPRRQNARVQVSAMAGQHEIFDAQEAALDAAELRFVDDQIIPIHL